ncbi:putative holin-like toxin [Lactococcus sp. DD01]|nr:putative holin-like toxin [Lactococcus sp. DD01]
MFESLALMFTFGSFILGLIDLILKIIKSIKMTVQFSSHEDHLD